ncbi:hypothetical protein BGZ83_006624 [Gryganskiella cystojenkinii]|nr:hypothetical protein BGZ83_006624 [Gryganskiella cystojenkinii]
MSDINRSWSPPLDAQTRTLTTITVTRAKPKHLKDIHDLQLLAYPGRFDFHESEDVFRSKIEAYPAGNFVALATYSVVTDDDTSLWTKHHNPEEDGEDSDEIQESNDNDGEEINQQDGDSIAHKVSVIEITETAPDGTTTTTTTTNTDGHEEQTLHVIRARTPDITEGDGHTHRINSSKVRREMLSSSSLTPGLSKVTSSSMDASASGSHERGNTGAESEEDEEPTTTVLFQWEKPVGYIFSHPYSRESVTLHRLAKTEETPSKRVKVDPVFGEGVEEEDPYEHDQLMEKYIIHDCAIHPDWRGQGLALKLWKALEESLLPSRHRDDGHSTEGRQGDLVDTEEDEQVEELEHAEPTETETASSFSTKPNHRHRHRRGHRAPVAAFAAAIAAGYYIDEKYQLSKDLNLVLIGGKSRRKFDALESRKACSMYDRFDEQCQLRPFSVALIFEGASYTWRDLELASNRIAHWLVAKGIRTGDRVAMMMHNSPMFLMVWLAILKMAAVPVFINNQITGPVLIHSLKVGDAKMLLFDFELSPVIQASLGEIQGLGYRLFTTTSKEQVVGQFYGHLSEDARQAIEIPSYFEYMDWQHLSTEGFPKKLREHLTMRDPAALIYTSGTTGFPKAAIMDHGRSNLATNTWGLICGIKPESKVYITLPLYHSAGSIIGVGQSWTTGCTIVLARKFSASNFWKDCITYDVTHFQYIGELCRYLLNAPESPLDKKHKVVLAFGNGMRPDVWGKFQDRFNIPAVFEYYTLSEGTAALFNLSKNKRDQGAIGFRGPILKFLQPGFKLVKIDMDTEELIRDEKTGHCIECGPNEVGELLTQADNKFQHTRYVGYFNQPKMSKAKLVENAFEKDDVYMRTGDLLYRSKDNYWYFADRAGDTFRWKGENVSTAEVADTIGRAENVASCTVYGVSIPGQDGRAGMAALFLKDSIIRPASESSQAIVDEAALEVFVGKLSEHVAKSLPGYAVPRFVRICEQELETTGTFKNKKVELKKEGFDLAQVKERMYWWTPQGRYLPFGLSENEEIKAGRARL